MKILKQAIGPDGNGQVTLKMENADDLWYAHNLLSRGDIIRAHTFRKIKEESKTGSVITTRKKIVLFLRAKSFEYDPEADTIRVSGTCAAENKDVQMNQHHTIELALHIPFTIFKKHWDILHIETLTEASDPAQSAFVAALVMEEGLAHLCFITNHSTVVKARIETQIPRKRKGASGHGKALSKFFEQCANSVAQHVNFEQIKCLLIASPGFVKDQFSEYLEGTAPAWYNREVIVYAHASSGERQALLDTLGDPQVKERLADVQFTQDLESIDEFFRMLSVDSSRVAYSLGDVETAVSHQAVQTLLVSDATLHTKRLSHRRRIVQAIQQVKASGGFVKVVSSQHVSGERLQQLSGIAALLRFPMYEFNDEDEESGDEGMEDPVADEEEEKLDLEQLGLSDEGFED